MILYPENLKRKNKMKKKTIINDKNMYVKSKESGLQTDIFYNRKAHNNDERGHTVISEGEMIFNRSAPALDIVMVSGIGNVSVSGALVCSI